MSQLVNYSIIEAGLRALADKAHESAVAQAEGKPIPCGLSENDMELVALLTAMMNDTQANKGWCAHEMGKSISSFEKYVHDGKIPEGIHDHVYVANMARADFYKSSIKDEEQLAQFIKDMVDDTDQKDGFIFNRFYADCCHNGVPIPWEDVL